MNERGMTLIELLLVATVITLMVLVIGFQFVGWQAKYKVETQLKVLHSDLMEMRMLALRTNRMHYIRFDDADYMSYNVFDDAGQVGALSKPLLDYPLRWNMAGNPVDIVVNNKGLMNLAGSIWIVDPAGVPYAVEAVDYDCVVIARTRINMGKYDVTQTTPCVAK